MNKKECTSCKFFDASLDGTRGINNRKLTGCTNAYGPHFFQGETTCSLWSEKEVNAMTKEELRKEVATSLCCDEYELIGESIERVLNDMDGRGGVVVFWGCVQHLLNETF